MPSTSQAVSTRRVGIEIEVESDTTPLPVAQETLRHSKAWEVVPETSLRGGMAWEARTAGGQGLPLEEAVVSCSELYPVLAHSSGTWRAAVHVHTDVRPLSWMQRALALCVAYAVDKSIFALVSPERVESNFCVPLSHKYSDVMDVISLWAHGDGTRGYGKYSSVNINNAGTLGTFEFRHMRTPQTDGSVLSVRKAIDDIVRFATLSAAVIDISTLVSVSRTQDVLDGFCKLVSSPYLWRRYGLEVDVEAAAELMRGLSPSHVDMMQYSVSSLARVARPYREGLRRVGYDPDTPVPDLFGHAIAYDEMLEEER